MPIDERKIPFASIGLWVVVLAAAVFGFFLGRYPSFHPDTAFFAWPAIRAARGLSFTYVVSQSAPYAHQFWAFHGPVWPRLLEAVYKVFGFSVLATRLPNFVSGWLAVFLLVLWLKRRGYRYAGLALAVLWCGDRAPLEIMCGRMDGLALLCVVLGFLSVERALRLRSNLFAGLGGILCGFSVLVHPSCAFVPLVALGLVLALLGWKAAGWFAAGGAINLALLAVFWRGQLRIPLAQLRWHLQERNIHHEDRWHAFLRLLALLRWSQFWVVALVLWTLFCVALALWLWTRRPKALTDTDIAFLLSAALALATVQNLFESPTFPPYLVFFTVWPMLCLAMLVETQWKRYRAVAAVMLLVWLSSVAWNALRFREAIKYYPELNRSFLYAEVRKEVPPGAELVATPELYAVPIEAGLKNYDLTTWFPEQEDVCAGCYLLMYRKEFNSADFVSRKNLDQRQVLYAGPAFPGAGPLSDPVVVLSPKH